MGAELGVMCEQDVFVAGIAASCRMEVVEGMEFKAATA